MLTTQYEFSSSALVFSGRGSASKTRRHGLRATAAIVGLLFACPPLVAQANEEAERIDEVIAVLHEIMSAPDASMPEALLERSVGIAVFPSTVRAGFFLGGQRGHGIIAARDEEAGAWSAPAFLTLTGGSIGLQVGAQSVDIILLIQNRRGLSRLLDNQFKLGGDASAAVGPVGRTLEASTDLQMTAEILSYSRSRGVFAGGDAGRRDVAGGSRRERAILRRAARLQGDRARRRDGHHGAGRGNEATGGARHAGGRGRRIEVVRDARSGGACRDRVFSQASPDLVDSSPDQDRAPQDPGAVTAAPR